MGAQFDTSVLLLSSKN